LKTYFNELDQYPALWLRNLFPDATVDDRSIKDVRPTDTADYLRCHFFAGIGGWEYALELAGWPADREVWTGSCPCQPFSVAGKRKGTEDDRHLWPEFLRLIAERLPATIFGEQVASADGRTWLSGIFADLEALGYAVAGADLCGASVGAPHIRQRLYWVATRRLGDGPNAGSQGRHQSGRHSARQQSGENVLSDCFCHACWSSDGSSERCDTRSGGEGDEGRTGFGRDQHSPGGEADGLSDSNVIESGDGRIQRGWRFLRDEGDPPYLQWGNTAIVCADGKARRIEPSILPLAHGIPNRVGRIRAYGNAIIPQVAARFIEAFLETESDLITQTRPGCGKCIALAVDHLRTCDQHSSYGP
jgi:DNA (cytosine-5)-methyltransferase 1